MKQLLHAVEQGARHTQPHTRLNLLALGTVETFLRVIEIAALRPELGAHTPLLRTLAVSIRSVDKLLDPFGVLIELLGIHHFLTPFNL